MKAKKAKKVKARKRFEWNLQPDDNSSPGLFDVQEGKRVITLHADYGNLMCLELTTHQPFTDLETWLNELSNNTLASEGIVETDPGTVFSINGFIKVDDNAWQKDDPRGVKYGVIQAGWEHDDSDNVYVLYTPKAAGRKQYRMVFSSPEEFSEWASDHT